MNNSAPWSSGAADTDTPLSQRAARVCQCAATGHATDASGTSGMTRHTRLLCAPLSLVSRCGQCVARCHCRRHATGTQAASACMRMPLAWSRSSAFATRSFIVRGTPPIRYAYYYSNSHCHCLGTETSHGNCKIASAPVTHASDSCQAPFISGNFEQ